ncbi:Mannose-specific lectin 1 [Platanthera zijinensis]|uniref:Mannose-specific lectin 1 n=1 Tax=Platanthera zijinensis TaxID=2320716 RepID=A0AAP0B5L8_9ASPA
MASSTTALLSSILLIFFLSSPSSANEGNILVSGDVLTADTQLSVDKGVFVIQSDCNLVLYNHGKGFQSNTSGVSTNCTLTLSDYGQLIITDVITGKTAWSSPAKGYSKGQYAAILQPDGDVGIYGPAVWSTPFRPTKNQFGPIHDAVVPNVVPGAVPGAAAEKISDNEPSAPNLLFSSEVLSVKSALASRDYKFELTKECGLRFTKSAHGNDVVWASPSSYSAGENCFARLNFHGQLSLLDDDSKVLWSTGASAEEGTYVLAVKINGQATIYGPRFWSTAA